MEGFLDRASPRRGSLTSLHRQSSGSFSHSSKLSNSLQANGNNINSLYKDLDKFTKYFILKAIQIIVQSRVDASRRLKAECRPAGNDWFNLNISDVAEITDRTKAALESEGLSVKSNWRVCCEISLKTSDDNVTLEHWIISNSATLNLKPKLASPKSLNQQNHRASTTPLSTSNNVICPLSTVNGISTGKARQNTISNTIRTRLNSIDDCIGDNDFASTKVAMSATNNENHDIKSSASCFSLSTTATSATQVTDQVNTTPSINSLAANNNGQSAQSVNNPSNSSRIQNSKTNTMSSIYTIYNRMSLLLKTLLTTTHIIPAYRLASRSSQMDSCVICYRVYVKPFTSATTYNARGSIDDISNSSDSPNKRLISSDSSFGSVNIRDYVHSDELDYFCPILKLGSIKTDVNQLDVSLCYRTDIKNLSYLDKSLHPDDLYNRILDYDCIKAAKQLLAGHDHAHGIDNNKQDHNSCSNESNICEDEPLNSINQPLRPAFASFDDRFERVAADPNLVLIESAFDKLLELKCPSNDEGLVGAAARVVNDINKDKCGVSSYPRSESIKVPDSSSKAKTLESSPGSTPKSLTDSFVFVDLNPPFASEEQNEFNSFFHGPSPTFAQGFDTLKDVDELTSQLAIIEANASQIDDFIDNICISDDEEGNC